MKLRLHYDAKAGGHPIRCDVSPLDLTAKGWVAYDVLVLAEEDRKFFFASCHSNNAWRRSTLYENPQLAAHHEQICCMTSLMKNEQQRQNLLLKVDPLLYFSQQLPLIFNPRPTFLSRDKLITQGEKRETFVVTKQGCATR